MSNVVHFGTRLEKKRRRRWFVRLALTVGLPLALLIYFLLLEQYGSLLLDLNDEEQVIGAAP